MFKKITFLEQKYCKFIRQTHYWLVGVDPGDDGLEPLLVLPLSHVRVHIPHQGLHVAVLESNNFYRGKALSSSLNMNLLLTLFGSRHCTCAYISCFKEEGWEYFCRFVFVCFTL